ncbi:hypothetical protein [Streptomyces sp. yr375]|uniref:hypothetical protein n=1 Tax=Streptomyces sp. yr375 TaxID=1761906 RepID=UPI0015A68E7F|nr:hypothetical protein [Streptomyces sp. yr375]
MACWPGTDGAVEGDVGGVGEEAREFVWVWARDCDGTVWAGTARCASEPVTAGRVYSDAGSSPPDVVGSSGAVAA